MPRYYAARLALRYHSRMSAVLPQRAVSPLVDLGEAAFENTFVRDLPVIAHNVSFDLGFLHRQRVLLDNLGLDTFELAGMLIPHAGRYSLGSLAREVGITLPATHRALDDARVEPARDDIHRLERGDRVDGLPARTGRGERSHGEDEPDRSTTGAREAGAAQVSHGTW